MDLGQKQTPVEESRGQRSMSAPPENRNCRNSSERDMGSYLSRPNRTQPSPTPQQNPRERIIPIHVEGRDEPILPKNINIEVQRPDPNDIQTNVHQQQSAPKYQAPPQSHHPQQAPPTFHPPQKQATPPPKQQEEAPPPQTANQNDPLEKIKSVKSDVLDLMQQVENFAGTRKEKLYAYLDEMLTRNLLKLDNVETEGKDNIRTARKEAIRCIQECINKLEAKAQANEKQNANVSTNEDLQLEPQENPSEVKKSDSKPVFKTTASIELQLPSTLNEPEVDIQTGNAQTEIKNTSHEPMKTDNATEGGNSLKMEIDSEVNVPTTSQVANETNN